MGFYFVKDGLLICKISREHDVGYTGLSFCEHNVLQLLDVEVV
jgi:hypothetical protein